MPGLAGDTQERRDPDPARREHDPDILFHLNQNIKPSSRGGY
jgi:hypothetical protein